MFLKATWSYTFLTLHVWFPDDVICNIAIYADATSYYKCDQAPNLWQQLEWISELEFDLRDTVVWGRKWLVDFNARKAKVLFGQCNNTGTTDVKIDGSVLKKKSSFKMLRLPFSSKLYCGSYTACIAKTSSMTIAVLIYFI